MEVETDHRGVGTTTRVDGAGCCSTRRRILGSGIGAAAVAHHWPTTGWQPCECCKEDFGVVGGGSVLGDGRSVPQ